MSNRSTKKPNADQRIREMKKIQVEILKTIHDKFMDISSESKTYNKLMTREFNKLIRKVRAI